jgi:hypothetical protein
MSDLALELGIFLQEFLKGNDLVPYALQYQENKMSGII